MKMDAANLEKPLILVTENRLYNQISRYYQKSVKIVLAEDLNDLHQILHENIDATLLLDLSLFNDDVDHSEVITIFKQGFEQRIIVITDEQDPAELYKLFAHGARGFCHSKISNEQLIKAIEAVDDGELWIGRKLIGYLMSRLFINMTRNNSDTSGHGLVKTNLTRRESDIAYCVAHGKCDKIIARDLNISPNTVKNHMRNIFNKLKIADRFQLALIYHGIDLT